MFYLIQKEEYSTRFGNAFFFFQKRHKYILYNEFEALTLRETNGRYDKVCTTIAKMKTQSTIRCLERDFIASRALEITDSLKTPYHSRSRINWKTVTPSDIPMNIQARMRSDSSSKRSRKYSLFRPKYIAVIVAITPIGANNCA